MQLGSTLNGKMKCFVNTGPVFYFTFLEIPLPVSRRNSGIRRQTTAVLPETGLWTFTFRLVLKTFEHPGRPHFNHVVGNVWHGYSMKQRLSFINWSNVLHVGKHRCSLENPEGLMFFCLLTISSPLHLYGVKCPVWKYLLDAECKQEATLTWYY